MKGQRFHQQKRIETKTKQFERSLGRAKHFNICKHFFMCCDVLFETDFSLQLEIVNIP